jgi:peptidoglycan/LPS O-acetylase OafA/YrhL
MTSTGRSVWAVFAGFLVVVVLSMGTDAVMHATGVFPPFGEPMSDSRFQLATAYRVVFTILGSYLTARLAPQRPMKHALVGGMIGLVLASVGAAATWNKGPDFGPHWYPLALVATALPCAWLGGRLGRQAEETQS